MVIHFCAKLHLCIEDSRSCFLASLSLLFLLCLFLVSGDRHECANFASEPSYEAVVLQVSIPMITFISVVVMIFVQCNQRSYCNVPAGEQKYVMQMYLVEQRRSSGYSSRINANTLPDLVPLLKNSQVVYSSGTGTKLVTTFHVIFVIAIVIIE